MVWESRLDVNENRFGIWSILINKTCGFLLVKSDFENKLDTNKVSKRKNQIIVVIAHKKTIDTIKRHQQKNKRKQQINNHKKLINE